MLEVLKVIILGIERGIYEHVQCGDPVRIYYGGRSNLFP